MIQKIVLSREEKKKLFKQVIQVWDEKNFTITNFQTISEAIKLPVTLIETMTLHYENLFSLGNLLRKLVFKGGTAVQHYLSPKLQRGSVDLDFNTSIGHPSAIVRAIEDVNLQLEQNNNVIDIEGITFGKFMFEQDDSRSGTVTFVRILPTKLNEFIKMEQKSIQAKKTKIQINYKHSWLPAIEIKESALNLFPSKFLLAKNNVIVPCASPGDLICDKILTLTQVKDFGRERLKDVYDLINLLHVKETGKYTIANKKLEAITRSEGIKKSDLVSSALNHLEDMKSISSQVIGFKSQVAMDGWKYIDNWENSIEETISVLESEFIE